MSKRKIEAIEEVAGQEGKKEFKDEDKDEDKDEEMMKSCVQYAKIQLAL